MPKTTINGVNIYYEDHGTGVPIVLIHGYVGSTYMWRTQVEDLSKDYRVITLDLRGHGQSDSPTDAAQYTVDLLVDDLYQLLHQLGVKQAVVGGLSYGGYLSLHFYYRHPEMVKALLIVDTGPGYRTLEKAADWNKHCEGRAQLLEARGMQGFMESDYSASDYYTPPDLMRKMNAQGLAHFVRVAMKNPYGVDKLKDIAVPTLLICGEQDADFIPATHYMKNQIPGSEELIVANAGHGVNIDQPAIFNNAVRDFLAKNGI